MKKTSSHAYLKLILNLPDEGFATWLGQEYGNLDISIIEAGKQRAEALADEDDLESAFRLLDRVEQIAITLSAPLSLARVWQGRANIYQYHEQFDQSLAATRKAVQLYQQYGTPVDTAKARIVEVAVLGSLERFNEAIKLAHTIRPLFADPKYKFLEARLTHALGYVYTLAWHLEDALTELSQAQQLFAELKMQRDAAELLLNMGVLANQMDRLTFAGDCYSQAYRTFSRLRAVNMMVKAQFNLAQNSIRQLDYEQALAHLGKARTFLARTPESPDIGYVDLHEAQVRQRLNEPTLATDLLRRALEHFKKLKRHIETAETQLDLGRLLATQSTQERLSDALSQLEQAESQLEKLDLPLFMAWVQLERAELLYRLDRKDEAKLLANTAQTIFEQSGLHLGKTQAQVLAADCHWRQAPQQAQQMYQAILASIGETVDPIAMRCWYGLGRLANAAGDASVAEQAYVNALKIMDTLRRSLRSHSHQAGFTEDKQNLNEGLLQALHSRSESQNQILTWLERFKASVLANLLVGQPADETMDTELRNLLTERERLTLKLDRRVTMLAAGTSLVSAPQHGRAVTAYDTRQTQESLELRDKLRMIDDEIHQRRNPANAWREGTAIQPHDVHMLLDRESVLISYYTVDNRLHALTVSHEEGDIEVHTLPVDLDEIERQWKQTKPLIEPDRDPRAAQRRLSRLWEYLIAPLEHRLQGKKRLLILPYRILFQIPFAGLYDIQNNRYLLQRWIVQITPSATVLQWCRQRPQPTRAPLFVGYPGKPDQSDYLPSVKPELATLKRLFSTADVLFGTRARANHVMQQASERAILHLAGHAFFDPDEPLKSGLPLAGGRWLRASDLYLRCGYLRGTTVVLSGCDTGRGQTSGADMLGLISAFLYAGATGVVAGLWPVDDAATCALMQAFYQNLANRHDTASALQLAQLTLLEGNQFALPYYWAPFSLNGDSRVI